MSELYERAISEARVHADRAADLDLAIRAAHVRSKEEALTPTEWATVAAAAEQFPRDIALAGTWAALALAVKP